MHSLFVFFLSFWEVLTGVFMFCTIMCILLVFNTSVARTSGASALWVLPVTPYNCFLYVVNYFVLVYVWL